MSENCDACVFFAPQGVANTEAGQIRQGFCRFNPPNVLHWLEPAAPSQADIALLKPGTPAQPRFTLRVEPTYAPTHGQQWCGRFVAPENYHAYKAAQIAESDLGDEEEERLS